LLHETTVGRNKKTIAAFHQALYIYNLLKIQQMPREIPIWQNICERNNKL